MAGEVLWWSVLCASISALSGVSGILVLARDQAREHRFAKMWFILHIITTSLAATYYSKVVRWQRVAQLRQYHGNFLWLSRVLGVPMMAAHLAETTLGLKHASQVLAGVGIAVFAIGCWGLRHRPLVTTVANWLVMAVMAVLCCLHCSVAGLCWCLLLSLALHTGTRGSPLLLPLPWCSPPPTTTSGSSSTTAGGNGGASVATIARIDLCHLLMAGCNVTLLCATPGL